MSFSKCTLTTTRYPISRPTTQKSRLLTPLLGADVAARLPRGGVGADGDAEALGVGEPRELRTFAMCGLRGEVTGPCLSRRIIHEGIGRHTAVQC